MTMAQRSKRFREKARQIQAAHASSRSGTFDRAYLKYTLGSEK